MPFVAYPSAFLYAEPDPSLRSAKSVEHWPWGYYVRPTGQQKNGFIEVRCRWEKKSGAAVEKHTTAWIRADEVQDARLLELNFVDIGQGDGVFVVLPDDTRLLIDAGETDNMHRFLRWRFNRTKVHIDDAVISHPDQDHYGGFRALLDDENFSFGNVYHNGIVERTGTAKLGPRTKGGAGKTSLLTDVIVTPEALAALVGKPSKRGQKKYPNLLHDMQQCGRVGAVWMLHAGDGHLPGHEADQAVAMQVLAPVPEAGQEPVRLRWFGDEGKTKNGHSVVLRLTYGNLSALLGGDLNIPSEEYLLEHHTGLDARPGTAEDERALVAAANRVFGCDVMKACHHGSADFTELFIQAVDPLASIISSGDDEPHCHPRPDALGAFGKHARGVRPCIFSTELARSTREYTTLPGYILAAIDEATAKLADDALGAAEKTKLRKEVTELAGRAERAVAVYGMISVRSDGERMIITQKLERKRSVTGEKWDIHRFEPGGDGRLRYVSKH